MFSYLNKVLSKTSGPESPRNLLHIHLHSPLFVGLWPLEKVYKREWDLINARSLNIFSIDVSYKDDVFPDCRKAGCGRFPEKASSSVAGARENCAWGSKRIEVSAWECTTTCLPWKYIILECLGIWWLHSQDSIPWTCATWRRRCNCQRSTYDPSKRWVSVARTALTILQIMKVYTWHRTHEFTLVHLLLYSLIQACNFLRLKHNKRGLYTEIMVKDVVLDFWIHSIKFVLPGYHPISAWAS